VNRTARRASLDRTHELTRVEHDPVLDHAVDMAQVARIAQGILVDYHEVRESAGRD